MPVVSGTTGEWASACADPMLADALWLCELASESTNSQTGEPLNEGRVDELFALYYAE